MEDELLPFFDLDASDGGDEFNFDRWSELVHSKDLISEKIKKIDKLYSRKKHITGIPTGFQQFDSMTSGLQNGELIVIGGRPSMGKTALASSIVEHIAVGRKSNVAYFSTDMSRDQIIERMIASRSHVDAHRVRSGYLSTENWPSLIHAADQLREANIFIDDTSLISVKELREKLLWLKKNHDIKLAVIDPVQLIHDFKKARKDPKRIDKTARSLKALAAELNIPVIILTQLSADTDIRENHYPHLTDLPGNGMFSRSADLVLLLFREEYYNPTEENRGLADVIVARQNCGPVGTVKLFFRKECMRFENLKHGE